MAHDKKKNLITLKTLITYDNNIAATYDRQKRFYHNAVGRLKNCKRISKHLFSLQ